MIQIPGSLIVGNSVHFIADIFKLPLTPYRFNHSNGSATQYLGTFDNSIFIPDNLPMSDSASNPDGTQLEDWCCDELDQPLDSDADTERISTPEFWAALAGENSPSGK